MDSHCRRKGSGSRMPAAAYPFRRRCRWPDGPVSSYSLRSPRADDAHLRSLIEHISLICPTHGRRLLAHEVRRRGVAVDSKRIQRNNMREESSWSGSKAMCLLPTLPRVWSPTPTCSKGSFPAALGVGLPGRADGSVYPRVSRPAALAQLDQRAGPFRLGTNPGAPSGAADPSLRSGSTNIRPMAMFTGSMPSMSGSVQPPKAALPKNAVADRLIRTLKEEEVQSQRESVLPGSRQTHRTFSRRGLNEQANPFCFGVSDAG